MIRVLFFCFLVIFIKLQAQAQVTTVDLTSMGIFQPTDGGTTKVTQDTRLTTVIKNQIAANNNKKLYGWRVQIFFGSGQDARANAEKIKKEFLKKYPDIGAYMVYETPFFKIRVGDFRYRSEAAKLRKEILPMFPTAFIVEEAILFPKL